MLLCGGDVGRPKVNLVLTADEPPVTQLVEQIERAVALGAYQAGDELPGATALAADLGISRVTVQKAYAILIERKIAAGRQGAGTFVKDDVAARAQFISRQLSEAILLGRNLYMNKAEIVDAFEREIKRHFAKRPGGKTSNRDIEV